MWKTFGIICMFLAFAVAPAWSQECLSWGQAELSGFVVEGVYPGPPEFSSVVKGDEALRATLLHLPQPICIEGEDELADGPVTATELIHLACDAKKTPHGELVTLRGNLCSGHSGYHVTAALLSCNL